MTQAEAVRGRGKARGTYAKTGLKKAAILDAALAVFAKSGYRAGSIREVAENVGMSEAGLLHHFPNKSALLAAVLDLRDQRAYEFAPLDSTDPHRALRGLVELARYNATISGVVELYCVLSAEATSPDHPAHEYFVNRYNWTNSNIASHFARLQAIDELRPGVSPMSAARQTVAMMDGLQVQWLLDKDSVNMSEELKGFLSHLVTFDI